MRSSPASDHGYRFPPDIISHAVGLSHRFCRSFRAAEDLLAQRGVTVTSETIRPGRGAWQLVDIAPVVLAHAGVDGSMDMDGRGLDADPSTLRAWSYPSMALCGAADRYRRELRSIEDGGLEAHQG